MSEIVKEKKKIIEKIPVNMSVLAFRFVPETFVNIETGEEVQANVWRMIASASLDSIMHSGRKIIKAVEEKDRTGKIRTVYKSVGREYGVEALRSALNASYPCTLEHAQKLIDSAIEKGLQYADICLRSDLVPCAKEDYDEKIFGENEWIILAHYPNTKEIDAKLNENLKKTGSKLRVKTSLKYRLAES